MVGDVPSPLERDQASWRPDPFYCRTDAASCVLTVARTLRASAGACTRRAHAPLHARNCPSCARRRHRRLHNGFKAPGALNPFTCRTDAASCILEYACASVHGRCVQAPVSRASRVTPMHARNCPSNARPPCHYGRLVLPPVPGGSSSLALRVHVSSRARRTDVACKRR